MAEPLAASPSVTSVDPVKGTELGGDIVTITGSRLNGATAVNFGAVPCDTFTVLSDASIQATSPPQAAGTVNITVTTSGGTSTPTPADNFTYKALPLIDAIEPPTGKAGDTVTITGGNFTEVDSVTFGDVAANYVIDSDTQITALVPGHPNGAVVVTISTPDGNSEGSDADTFTYAGGISPNLTGITIANGEALSAALDCTLKHPLLFFMPDDWGSSVLTFCISIDDVTYFDLYRDGKEVTLNVVPNSVSIVPSEWFVTGCYVKARSGTRANPVVQSDDRTFMIVMSA